MEFSWDENKRLKTLDSRGLDFIGARLFFDGRPVVHQPTARHDEDRWKSTAAIEGAFYTVIWLWRGEKLHIISMRRAHAQEIRKYREFHSGWAEGQRGARRDVDGLEKSRSAAFA